MDVINLGLRLMVQYTELITKGSLKATFTQQKNIKKLYKKKI